MFVGVVYEHGAIPVRSIDLGRFTIPADTLPETMIARRGMWPVTPWLEQGDGTMVAKLGAAWN